MSRTTRKHEAVPTRRSFAGKRPVLRFVLLFVVYMAIFYALTGIATFQTRLFPAYLKLNASATAWILRGFGEQARSYEQSVMSPQFQLSIARGCDAIEPAALFAAAVLAFPALLRRKLVGLAAGIPLLLVLNLLRIVSLYYAGVHAPDAFETMHIEVWQPLFILLAIVGWIAWMLWATRDVRRT